jgi:hypothetical protein
MQPRTIASGQGQRFPNRDPAAGWEAESPDDRRGGADE